MSYKVPVGLSNKHVHISEKHLEILFGEGYELTPFKALKQPGQYAAEEKIDVVSPKGSFRGVRILGPLRNETQVELSITDARTLGVTLPVRESGKLNGTPGLKLIGPEGEVDLDHGAIVAFRHVHLSPSQAKEAGVVDKQIVSIRTDGERGLVFDNVMVRTGEGHEAEAHFDTDEGNAAGLCNGDLVEILI